MDQNNHFAAGSPAAFERERLGFHRDLADPITTRRLTQLPVGSAVRTHGHGIRSAQRTLRGMIRAQAGRKPL
jgi:hypothetical protein